MASIRSYFRARYWRPATIHQLPTVLLAVCILLAGSLSVASQTGDGATTRPAAERAAAVQGGLLFGLGPQAHGALDKRIVKEAPVNMVTSWYNYRTDMGFFDIYRSAVTPQIYAAGKAMHLVIWDG